MSRFTIASIPKYPDGISTIFMKPRCATALKHILLFAVATDGFILSIQKPKKSNSDREQEDMCRNMFVLESISGNYVIDARGNLQEKPCKPMKFTTKQSAQDWANNSGIKTPLIPVDVRETDGY